MIENLEKIKAAIEIEKNIVISIFMVKDAKIFEFYKKEAQKLQKSKKSSLGSCCRSV